MHIVTPCGRGLLVLAGDFNFYVRNRQVNIPIRIEKLLASVHWAGRRFFLAPNFYGPPSPVSQQWIHQFWGLCPAGYSSAQTFVSRLALAGKT